MADARKFKAWLFKSKSGKTFLSIAGLFIALCIVWYFKGRDKVTEVGTSSLDSLQTIAEDSAEAVREFETGVPGYKRERQLPTEKEKEEQPKAEKVPYNFPISIYSGDESSISPETAPYGQLIECKLVNTVDSINLTTPIIAIVLRDIYSADGTHLVLPANTLIHGTASSDRSRERIGAGDNWILVWQDGTGRELPITGLVLDHGIDHRQGGWTPSDGSSGLKGRIIRTDRLAELKLFAAEFIRGSAQQAIQSELLATNGGTIQSSNGSTQNIVAGGIESAATIYAQSILRSIQRDGFFVRVASGKNFYVYVTQPLDTAGAYPGASLSQTDQ